MEQVTVGIIGAGNRGQVHTREYQNVPDTTVKAVADIDEGAAKRLATEYNVADVYTDYADMLADDEIDVVSVSVHNNLHAPISIDAMRAGKHVFCEKPIAGSYADAKRMFDVAAETERHFGVQNMKLFEPETTAAKRLVDDGRLGDVSYAQAIRSRRRGRPYIDGYGTPAFVTKSSAGGGPIYDIGTYEIGRMLYLLGNPQIERIGGQTWVYTQDQYTEELIGDNLETYTDRLEQSGYDVEDAGVGYAKLEDGKHFSIRAAWHMYLDEGRDVVTGSKGGLTFDPLEFYTTIADYEASVSLDVDGYEARQSLLASESGYDFDNRPTQFDHWIGTIRGTVDPIPTAELALNSMLIMEGIYLADEFGRDLSADEVAEHSESKAVDL